MTTTTRFIRNWSSLAIALVLLTTSAQSAFFTAVASGNWNSFATWGQTPPQVNNTNNQITIPAGVVVTSDVDMVINGATASLSVVGTLSAPANITLTLTQGVLGGTGTLNVGTLSLSAGSLLAFSGAMTVEYLSTASTGLQLKSQVTVSKGLNLTGGTLTVATGGQLSPADNSMITVSGGSLVVSGGLLTLTNPYNVRYMTVAATTGVELSGAGLTNITIDVPAGVNVSLGSNLTVSATGNLYLTTGTLKLNGKNLTVNGGMTIAEGTAVSSTALSSITINSAAGTIGALDFPGTTNQVLNLSIGVGANTTAIITGTLEVTGVLDLSNGALRFAGTNLTLGGNVTGAGMLSGDALSNLTINTPGGVPLGIRFAPGGQAVKNLTINVGVNYPVRLLSNLVVGGLTTLSGSSNLNISDLALTINGDVAGTGTFIVTGNTSLTVNTPNGLSQNLTFTGNTIGTLVINTDSTKTVGLGSDLIIWQSLDMRKGTLVLNGNDLTINGDIVALTSGYIRSTSTSDINIVSQTGGTAGSLRFAGTDNAVKNLTISVLGSASTGISGTLTVENTLNLQSGTLKFPGATLILNGSVTGAGPLGSDASSSLTVNASGGVPAGMTIKDAAGGSVISLKNITINVGAANTVKILNDLSIVGTTTLTSGGLDIGNFDLSLGGPLSGPGTFVVNGNSGIMINTLGGLTGPISLTGPSIGDFGVNVGTGGTVSLGSDIVVSKTLALNGGTLNLNGNNLTVGGNIVGGVSGTVTSTETSDVSIVSSTSTTGTLRFADNSAVGTLKIDVGAANTARIGGNLDVMTTLDLTSGVLAFHDADLTLTGVLVGSGSLSGNASSNLTVNTPGGLTTGLQFAPSGKTLKNLTINVGAASAVNVLSDLVVNGALDLAGGTLSISEVDLTIGGPITGTGSIGVDGKSGLIINTPGGLTAPLTLVGTTIGVLTVNVGAGGSVSLSSDIDVSSRFHLKSGTLVLNGNDLTISGLVDGTGSGTLSSTNASNITLATTLSSTGKIVFDAAANTMNNLTIETAINGAAYFGSNASVSGVLTLTNGHLNLGGNTLTIGASGSIVGGSSSSYVRTLMGGALSMMLNAGASAATVFPVGTASNYLPAGVTLNAGSTAGNVNVGVSEGVYAQGTNGSLISATEATVNATWDVTSDIASNLKMNLELAWAAQAEVNGFDRTQAYISHYTSDAWDGTAKASATTRADGMFSLTRTNIESLSPFAVFDGSTTDVVSEALASNYNVFPSPATDVIVIQNLATAGIPMTVDIIDAQGRVVSSLVMIEHNLTIPLHSFSSGVYFVRLHNDTASATKSFVKL